MRALFVLCRAKHVAREKTLEPLPRQLPRTFSGGVDAGTYHSDQ